MSTVPRALYQEGVSRRIRIFSLRRNEKGTITGLATPFALAELLLRYRDAVLSAAREVDNSIVGIQVNEAWRRVEVQIDRYIGGGFFEVDKLRAEIGAENEEVERFPWQLGGSG